MKIGILREEKQPFDRRVVLSPEQCFQFLTQYPEASIIVERSPHRCFTDGAYEKFKIQLVDTIRSEDADILLGVKEVPISKLIPGKTYLFFSHTIKEQPYNQELLQNLVDKAITMIDYECLVDKTNTRIIGFGAFAGIVGAHHGLITYISKNKGQKIKQANECEDYNDLVTQYDAVVFPKNTKIIVTGRGRVAQGIMRLLNDLNIQKIDSENFLNRKFDAPSYIQLTSSDYYYHSITEDFSYEDFKNNPHLYKSSLGKYLSEGDILLNGIFWNEKLPQFFDTSIVNTKNFNIDVISDISCDVKGSIPLTIRESYIDSPVYSIDKATLKEVPNASSQTVEIIAVSNMPCELPVDASISFGVTLINKILPEFFKEKSVVLEKATICKNKILTPHFSHLTNYLNGFPEQR